MGKIFEVKIKDFSGGISDSPRSQVSNACSLLKHFDIFSDNNRLTPFRSTEADTNDGTGATGLKQYDVRHFQLGLDGKLYGLGKTAAGYPKIVSKADPTTGNWTLETTAEGNAARILGCFIEWQNAFYFFEGSNKIAKWTIGSTVDDAVATVGSTILTVAQGIVGADGNLYLFYNNKVVRVSSAGVPTDDVLTALPSDMRITSVARYGGYLAIGMAYGTSATATPSGRSQVFIWDMVTTTTVADVLDWGEGALMVLGNIEGRLVGVSDKYLSSSLGLSKGSMVVRMWAGGAPQVFKEVVANQVVTLGRFIQDVVIKNNKLYWVASVPFGLSTSTESTFHLGIWVFGRKNINSNFTLSLEYIFPEIDTSNFKINSFGAAGDYWFANISADGSVVKTDDASNFTTTSQYESLILNGEDASETKKLIGITVFFAPLPSGGTIVLKYRKDEDSSYTQIFSHTTANSLSHSAINLEASGNNLPEFKEIQFQILSTGNVEITGLKFAYEIIEKDLY